MSIETNVEMHLDCDTCSYSNAFVWWTNEYVYIHACMRFNRQINFVCTDIPVSQWVWPCCMQCLCQASRWRQTEGQSEAARNSAVRAQVEFIYQAVNPHIQMTGVCPIQDSPTTPHLAQGF